MDAHFADMNQRFEEVQASIGEATTTVNNDVDARLTKLEQQTA